MEGVGLAGPGGRRPPLQGGGGLRGGGRGCSVARGAGHAMAKRQLCPTCVYPGRGVGLSRPRGVVISLRWGWGRMKKHPTSNSQRPTSNEGSGGWGGGNWSGYVCCGGGAAATLGDGASPLLAGRGRRAGSHGFTAGRDGGRHGGRTIL